MNHIYNLYICNTFIIGTCMPRDICMSQIPCRDYQSLVEMKHKITVTTIIEIFLPNVADR